MNLRFRVDERELAVARLAPDASVPDWASVGDFTSITRTSAELSIVCDASAVPAEVSHERDWAMLVLEGPFPFDMTGVLESFIAPLAKARIGIFAMATFDTDYVLLKRAALDEARRVLAAAGHEEVAA